MHCTSANVWFGAWISKELADTRPPARVGSVSIGEGDRMHISVSLSAGEIKIPYDKVLRLVVHPSETRLCLLFDGVKLPRELWAPQATLVVEFLCPPQPSEWLITIEASLPVLRAPFELQELPPLQLPSNFSLCFVLEALQHCCYHRLTQVCVDQLSALSDEALLLQAAALAKQVESDPLTALEPVEAQLRCEVVHAQRAPLDLPGLHLVRQCEIHLYGERPQLPRLVQGSRLLEMAEAAGVLDFLLMVTFVNVDGERMSKEAAPIVKRVFEEGLVICGRRYRFLAASSDQLRHGGAWLLCEDNPRGVRVQDLREGIGDLSGIQNVSKFLARLGLALTTSTLVADLEGCISVEDDICSGGHCFTDGCGEMSQEIAEEVQRGLGLKKVPSAIQVRIGGIKGMLVLSRSLPGRRVRIRNSMVKFHSNDTGLRVVSVAAAAPTTLNHDVLTLLGSHVPRQRWHDLLRDAILRLSRSLYGASSGVEEDCLLSRFDSAFACIAGPSLRHSAGANPLNDPFMLQVLRGSYMSAVTDLCERMHIPVKDGVLLAGVADPTGSLAPDEIVVCYNGQVIEGTVIVYRNPACHPGDIRRLRAVSNPNLAFLEDVVVFSTVAEYCGAPPQFARCSGGDLDGDLYAVLFDIDPIVDLPPADGRSPTNPLSKPLSLDDVNIDGMVQYGSQGAASEADGFLRVALNDALGQASNAHKAMADRSEFGAYEDKCLQLAALVNIAVDSPKTGDIVELDQELRSPQYPDWMMHPRKPTYASFKVLGELFRSVRDLHAVRCLWQTPNTEDYASCSYIQSEADPNLKEICGQLFTLYKEKVDLALMGWKLKSEVEMLVGPLRRTFSRRQFHRHRDIITKTRFIFAQICDYFGKRFDELLDAPAAPCVKDLAVAWWAVDPTGRSAFRWIPWRRHGEELRITLQSEATVHRMKSFPLLRLGQAMKRRSESKEALPNVLESFLESQLATLLESTGKISERCGHAACLDVAKVCAETLIEQLQQSGCSVCSTSPSDEAEYFEGCDLQETGRRLVAAVLALPSCVAAAAPALENALKNCGLQHQVDRFVAHVRRLLACHAHNLCVSLDLQTLFHPIRLHDHILPLTLKQLAIIRSTNNFVTRLEEKSGARISIRHFQKHTKDRRPAVWSLQLRGTFAQLVVVEQELARVQCTPAPDRQAFEHAISAIELSAPVDRDALVAINPQSQSLLMNPVHARRGARPFQFEVVAGPGTWTGDGGLQGALEKALELVQPFQEAEISIQLGTLYVLDPPAALIGTSPARPLAVWEVLKLIDNGHEIQLPAKGKGRGRGKTWTMRFLKSGFNNTVARPPESFSPAETFVSTKVRLLGHERHHLSIKFIAAANGGLAIAEISKDEARLMTFTERACMPRFKDDCAIRGDVRINLNVHTPLSPEEDLYRQITCSPPLSLLPGKSVKDPDWYLDLHVNGAGVEYEFETIRVHHRESRSMKGTDGFVHNVGRVVWLLAAEKNKVCVEADCYETDARLHMELTCEVDSATLLDQIAEAKRQLVD